MSSQRPRDKVIGSVNMPDINSKEVLGVLQSMKAITATSLATRFDLKISVAKKMLNRLEENGTITMVTRSSNLKVYTLADSKGVQ